MKLKSTNADLFSSLYKDNEMYFLNEIHVYFSNEGGCFVRLQKMYLLLTIFSASHTANGLSRHFRSHFFNGVDFNCFVE